MDLQLIDMLPDYYKENETMLKLQEIFTKRAKELREFLLKEFSQIFPTLTTSGLSRWEKILDIKSDISIDLKSRRERICSKLLSNETTTIDVIKAIIKVFTNGDVEIIEENELYHFKVKFTNIIGRPKRLESVRNAIEELKPAHLSYEFIFLYNAHKDLKRFTFKELKQIKHTSLRNEVLKNG